MSSLYTGELCYKEIFFQISTVRAGVHASMNATDATCHSMKISPPGYQEIF